MHKRRRYLKEAGRFAWLSLLSSNILYFNAFALLSPQFVKQILCVSVSFLKPTQNVVKLSFGWKPFATCFKCSAFCWKIVFEKIMKPEPHIYCKNTKQILYVKWAEIQTAIRTHVCQDKTLNGIFIYVIIMMSDRMMNTTHIIIKCSHAHMCTL